MAQKTNLNVSPYYDDFYEKNLGAKDKNYYKILFNPGRPVQARELNSLQSMLQNQVESFGSHIFKEGSLVIPGAATFDNQFYAVKLNAEQFGVNITAYLSQLVGKRITGDNSRISAIVQRVQVPTSEVEYSTLYVKYVDSDTNFEINPFEDNEPLTCDTNIVYGNTTINAGTTFATTIPSEATATGSAVSIDNGVYFIRGYFVNVAKQTIILDYYGNTPSYRVGLQISEEIITPKDDDTLYDNAKGFSNFAAPGADRFQISTTLTKKLLDDLNDTDFIEVLRIENGEIKKTQPKTEYNLIRDYFAERTYDESGDYVVEPFDFSINNSLNNRLGNDGLFFANQKTEEGNTPSSDLACIKFSPGKAYVRGFDIEKPGVEIVDVEKPRTTAEVTNENIPFEMGNLVKVNNLSGTPVQKGVVYLQDQRKNSSIAGAGSSIGVARIYTCNLTDAAYSGDSTNWDLYLYDIQTNTRLTLNTEIGNNDLPIYSRVRGLSSGATAFVSQFLNGRTIDVRETSGSFQIGEQLEINGNSFVPRTITDIQSFGTQDIKSLHQPTAVSGFSTAFLADTRLGSSNRSETLTITNAGAVTVSAPASLSGITTGSIIRYQVSGSADERYNRVTSVNPDLLGMTLTTVDSVTGVCNGSFPATTVNVPFSIGEPQVLDTEKGSLYAELPDTNIASVDLSGSTISFVAQTNPGFTHAVSSTITVNLSSFDLGVNATSAAFAAFDEERYSIFYTDGSIENLTADKVAFPNSSQVTFSNIATNTKTIAAINASFVKNTVQSKSKIYTRSTRVNIDKSTTKISGVTTSIQDGLTYSAFYGTRVQDEEICINFPDAVKVLAIYESLNTDEPVEDRLVFSTLVDTDTNVIIGENLLGSTSNTYARVVSKPSANTVGVVYLTNSRFEVDEVVTFEESNIITNIENITIGAFKDVSNKYTLDKGQKKQYYDYSRIVRRSGESAPAKKVSVFFDHYTVPAGDEGDVFTVNSYDEERFEYDVPFIETVRSTDTLDFRPRVSQFTSTSQSPFDFDARNFGTSPKILMAPNEGAILGYQYYLGRIDKLILNKNGEFVIVKGEASKSPKPPSNPDQSMELATLVYPPYLYNPSNIGITLEDNRRYTMRDIGKIEDRVENLERVTSLSLLELNTQTLQVQDANGINRFKSGFFVDNFETYDFINAFSEAEIDDQLGELSPRIARNSINLKPVAASSVSDESFDEEENFALFDSNTQKTGEVITLKYDSVEWIKQPYATQVENINPFNIISYIGAIKVSPEQDTWVRRIQLDDVNINVARTVVRNVTGWGGTVVSFSTSVNTENRLLNTGAEIYMRSRNTGFVATNLKPLTRIYQFLDGNGSVDFIPKLIEIATDTTLQNYGASAAFTVGETVIGNAIGLGGVGPTISFRVASSKHKEGPFNNPTIKFGKNPYYPSENISESYSASSKTLNVDITALSAQAQGLYAGYIIKGMQLVGQTSGAIAYVKDVKLVSDQNGFLSGSFFLRDPNALPTPTVRIGTGAKVYKLTSSSTNATPLPGSKLISSGQAIYRSAGTFETYQRYITTTVTRTITNFIPPPPPPPPAPIFWPIDPLAQTFTVAVDPTDFSVKPEDLNGAYLTAVDLFFASKDSGNAPVTVEIRTVELGTPTTTVIGRSKTLQPEQVQTSADGTVATNVVFDYPIYLEAAREYALVLLSPESDQYEVWIAEMGEKTIETINLPDSQAVRFTQQFGIGSLFKSQNGSIWSPNQYQDLKFRLYKAKFAATSGSALFHNPTLDASNSYVPELISNPITTVPRRLTVGITTISASAEVDKLSPGKKVSTTGKTHAYGFVDSVGCRVDTAGITTGGTNYTNTNGVETFNIVGSGSGLKLDITTTNGSITGIGVDGDGGTGYRVGDVVGIVTSSVSPAAGVDARISVETLVAGVDTLYLTDVQGQSFDTSQLTHFNGTSMANVTGATVHSSTPVGGIHNGNFFNVIHGNHGMYALNNKLTISNVESDIVPTILDNTLETSASVVSVANTSTFDTYEGLLVDGNNPGYVKVGNEIIKYTNVTSTSLEGITRGIDSTITIEHPVNTQAVKYELAGVSLRRVNRVHDMSNTGVSLDNYYVEFDRSAIDGNTPNRSADQGGGGDPANSPQLSFSANTSTGGNNVKATENIQFNTVAPLISSINPSAVTNTTGQIRTVSGTSVNGNEVSFVDQGYEPIQLDAENRLSSTRIVCSQINETTHLDDLLRNKSFTLKIDMSTTDSNVSPMIFWKNSLVQMNSNRLNAPIANYARDGRVNEILGDPHAAYYISNPINLEQPATSLKVILSAYRHASSDFRVLYSLLRADSSEVEQTFELFPGYNNLKVDSNQDGFADVINPANNDGLPDTFVPASLEDQFLEYEFNANNLDKFVGYQIKIVMSGTNQAFAPRFRDIRTIALA